MIVRLSALDAAVVLDADRLDRLSVESSGPVADMRLEPMCAVADIADHVWLDVVALRRAGAAESADEHFGDRFDAMIAYAAEHDWLSDDRSRVLAHVELIT